MQQYLKTCLKYASKLQTYLISRFEFSVTLPKWHEEDSARIVAHYVGLLKSAGPVATGSANTGSPGLAHIDYSNHPFSRAERNSPWAVQSYPNPKCRSKQMIRVTTPALPADRWSFQTVQKVCWLITASSEDKPVRDCVLRVQVSTLDTCRPPGHPIRQGFMCHHIIRHLTGFLWVYEDQLDKFLPLTATGPQSPGHGRQSLHECTPLADEIKRRASTRTPMSGAEALERILSSPHTANLLRDLHHPDFWGFEKDETLASTNGSWHVGAPGVAFPLEKGKLIIVPLQNWIRVLASIVKFIDNSEYDSGADYSSGIDLFAQHPVDELFRGDPTGDASPPQDILVALGLEELLPFYLPYFDEHAKPLPSPKPELTRAQLENQELVQTAVTLGSIIAVCGVVRYLF